MEKNQKNKSKTNPLKISIILDEDIREWKAKQFIGFNMSALVRKLLKKHIKEERKKHE